MALSTFPTTGTPRPSPDSHQLYTIVEAARLLSLKPDTLRKYIKRNRRVTPQRLAVARGVMLLTAADVMEMWQFIRTQC
jgi:DNA-binding transcriptional MerR regulator